MNNQTIRSGRFSSAMDGDHGDLPMPSLLKTSMTIMLVSGRSPRSDPVATDP